MHPIRQMTVVPPDRELRIRLPDSTRLGEPIRVTIEIAVDVLEHERKMREMEAAAHDPLFLADIKEIMDDFRYVDMEGW